MNKTVVYAIGAVALLGAGYAGASWYAGNQIATALDANATALREFPAIKIVKRDVQNNVFGAVENVTYQIGCETSVDASHPLHGTLGTLTLKNTISHHPFNLAIDTAIQYDEKTKAALAKIFKDQQPLSIHTKLDLSGGFRTQLAVPAFKVDDAGTSLTSQALTATIQSDRDLSFFNTTLKQGGIEVLAAEQKSKLATGALDYQSKVKKTPEGLYIGSDNLKLASVQVLNTQHEKPLDLRIGATEFISETGLEAGLLRGSVKGQVNDMALNNQKIGSLNLDAAVVNLNAKAIQAINQVSGVKGMLQCKSDPAAQMKVLQEQAQALLDTDPKYSQKISLKTPEGESVLAFHLQGKGITKADLASPDLLRNKLDASLSMQVPKALIERLITDLAQADAVESSLASFQQSLGMGVEQGFVVSDGKLIKANFTVQQGQTVLNGKPFDPMQLMGQR